MSQEVCENIMRRYLEEVVVEGKYEVLEEIAAEDMVDHTAVKHGWPSGRAGLEQHVRYFRQCVPDLKVEILRVIASENEVVGMWRAQGTHSEILFGIPATGKRLDYNNASIFKVKNGKLVDYTGVWGALDAVQQMGVPIALPETK